MQLYFSKFLQAHQLNECPASHLPLIFQ